MGNKKFKKNFFVIQESDFDCQTSKKESDSAYSSTSSLKLDYLE